MTDISVHVGRFVDHQQAEPGQIASSVTRFDAALRTANQRGRRRSAKPSGERVPRSGKDVRCVSHKNRLAKCAGPKSFRTYAPACNRLRTTILSVLFRGRHRFVHQREIKQMLGVWMGKRLVGGYVRGWTHHREIPYGIAETHEPQRINRGKLNIEQNCRILPSTERARGSFLRLGIGLRKREAFRRGRRTSSASHADLGGSFLAFGLPHSRLGRVAHRGRFIRSWPFAS